MFSLPAPFVANLLVYSLTSPPATLEQFSQCYWDDVSWTQSPEHSHQIKQFSDLRLWLYFLADIIIVHQISRTYSSYNWRFVHFDEHLPSSPIPQFLVTTILLSASRSLAFIDPTCKLSQTIFVFSSVWFVSVDIMPPWAQVHVLGPVWGKQERLHLEACHPS